MGTHACIAVAVIFATVAADISSIVQVDLATPVVELPLLSA